MDNENFTVDFGEVTNVGGGGTSDFNELTNRPKYDSNTMSGDTNIPKVPSKTSDLTNDSDYQTETEVSDAISTAIGAISIPTKTSDLTNDGADGQSTYVETDELAAVATSGSYNDLDDKPSIPTYSDFTGTDGTSAGAAGLVPAPTTADVDKFLKSDGTWEATGGSGGGGIKFLSASDFNYDDGNTGSFNTVAMWLLDDGFYFMPSDYTAVPVKGALDGTNVGHFNTAISNKSFYCFIKANNCFWMFVNSSSQDATLYANRPIFFCKINPANGWFTPEDNYQLAKRSELTA